MLESKLIKKKQLDEETTVSMTRIGVNSRIVVEFRHVSGKMVRQSFQDTFEGRAEADRFSKSIKNTKELRKYFGLGDKE